MFDNMGVDEIKKIIAEVKSLELYDRILFEASGSINESNIGEYCEAGVDIISMGMLTHSIKAFGTSLKITK